jgi:hypothetical protein
VQRTGILSAVLIAALVFTGNAAASTRHGCRVGKGKTVLRTPGLVVYSRVNRGDPYGARTVYACAWRTGRARTIGSRVSLDTESADTKVRAHAGVHLVVDASHDDQYAHAVRTTWWNIATGRKRTLYALHAPIAGPARTTGARLDRALLTSDGCTVLALSIDRAANTATVLSAPFSGPLAEFDHGTADAVPIAGLGLAGRTATWTNAGQPRRADLARAAC